MNTTTYPETDPGTAIFPTVSIDALLAARDGYIASLKEARDKVGAALDLFAPFASWPPSLELCMGSDHVKLSDLEREEAWIREIDRAAWRHLFEKSGLGDLMSGKRREELSNLLHRNQIWARREEDKVPPLTRENIEATFGELFRNAGDLFEESVEEVYRALSWDHKTNAPSRLQRKMILSYGADYWPGSRTWGVTHDANRVFDLERVLCRLAGIPQPSHQNGIRARRDYPFATWLEGNYGEHPAPFRFKGFRKRTLHIEVHDRGLVDQMNRIMARRHPGELAPPMKGDL